MLAVSAAVAACGGDDGAAQREREAQRQRQQQERHARERADEARQRADEARELEAACSDQLGTLVERLGELDSRLSVGLNYDEYTDEVAELRVAYDKIDFDELGESGFGCLSGTGLPAEKALNQYAKAATRWGECIDDFGWDTDAIEPALQRRWSHATDFVETAADELDQMDDEAVELEQSADELADAASEPGATDATTERDASQPQDSAAEFTRAVNDAAGGAVDTVTVEDTGRVAIYLEFGEGADELESEICDAVGEVQTEARAAIYQYHDRERDTTYIAGSCGTLKTP